MNAEAKILYDDFMKSFLYMIPMCEKLKATYGNTYEENKKIVLNSIKKYRIKHICLTQVHAVTAMASIADSEHDLHWLFACISKDDLKIFKDLLESGDYRINKIENGDYQINKN